MHIKVIFGLQQLLHDIIFCIKMANIYVSTAVAIKTVKQMFYLIAEHKPGYTHNYAFIDFKQWLTLTFPDWNH